MKAVEKLGLIGDVHGHQQHYLGKIAVFNRSLQLGDMGFNYDQIAHLDPNQHAFFAGNHDRWPLPKQALKPGYGLCSLFTNSFYVQGAYSVDKDWRLAGRNWFPDEELSLKEMEKCFEEYQKTEPDVLFSHDCPSSVGPYFYGFEGVDFPLSRTAQLLEVMFEHLKPKIWVFGHHHRTGTVEHKGTLFVCLGELVRAQITRYEDNSVALHFV